MTSRNIRRRRSFLRETTKTGTMEISTDMSPMPKLTFWSFDVRCKDTCCGMYEGVFSSSSFLPFSNTCCFHWVVSLQIIVLIILHLGHGQVIVGLCLGLQIIVLIVLPVGHGQVIVRLCLGRSQGEAKSLIIIVHSTCSCSLCWSFCSPALCPGLILEPYIK